MVIIIAVFVITLILMMNTFDLLPIERISFTDIGEFFICALTALVMSLLAFMFIIAASSYIDDDNLIFEKQYDKEIIALKDDGNADGRFFLGSGYINNDMVFYYVTNEHGTYKISRIKAGDATIIYSEDSPRIEKYSAEKFVHWWYYIFAIPVSYYTQIYVPEGTIQYGFNIDLE